MKTFSKITKTALLLCILLGLNEVQAQDGEALFKQNCTACHTVGGGRLVGPDLKGVTDKRSEDWLVKFIKSSQSLIKSGDAEAKAIYEEYNQVMMPDQNLSDDQIKSILTYIESQGPAESSAPAEEADAETAAADGEAVEEITEEEAQPQKNLAEATEKDVEIGGQYFEGELSFENGGPSCVSCHNITNDDLIPGGLLAKDLTGAFSRLGGEAGISGILTSYPFPAMASSYKAGKELTDEEVYALMAFMKYADENSIYQHENDGNGIYMYGGGFGLLALLGIIYLLWYNRKRKHTKEEVFKRQLRAR